MIQIKKRYILIVFDMSDNTMDEPEEITDSLESDDDNDDDLKSDIAAAYLDMLSSFV